MRELDDIDTRFVDEEADHRPDTNMTVIEDIGELNNYLRGMQYGNADDGDYEDLVSDLRTDAQVREKATTNNDDLNRAYEEFVAWYESEWSQLNRVKKMSTNEAKLKAILSKIASQPDIKKVLERHQRETLVEIVKALFDSEPPGGSMGAGLNWLMGLGKTRLGVYLALMISRRP